MIIFVLLAVTISTCARGTKHPANVLLITVDTLRPDHLGCYGNHQFKTPNFDRLAREGVLFEKAFCQVPLTLPSHASILTGTYPMFHGIRDQGQNQYAKNVRTLAGMLKEKGYQTAAFVGSFVLDSRFGLKDGFDYYFDNFDAPLSSVKEFQSVERPANEVAKDALRWIGLNSEKFFAWLHFYDPHDPYQPPEPFRTTHSNNLYDGEIAFVDSVLGDLFDFLQKQKLYDNTLIVLLSDHGEGLTEHGETYHGLFVYDSTLRIPLLIKPPENCPAKVKVIAEPVETVDVVPTVLEFLDFPSPNHVQGRTLLPKIKGNGSVGETDLYGETYYPRQFAWSELRTVRSGRYKYISAPRVELFDTERDPHELNNLATQDPTRSKALHQRLADLSNRSTSMASVAQGTTSLPSTDVVKKLQSLGYVGGSSRSIQSSEPGYSLPDPKDKIVVYEKFQRALLASSRQDPGTAALELNSVIRMDPDFMDARILLGLTQRRQGQHELAFKSFAAAYKQRPDDANTLYNLALSYLHLGRVQEAETHLKKVIMVEPGHSDAHADLGGIYQSTGRTDEAVLQYQDCLRINPLDYQALNNLAAIYLARDSDSAAVELLERVVKLDPKRFEAHNNLGSAYLKLKKFGQALAEFEKANELNPGYGPVQANIGLVYMAQGRIDEARDRFTRILQIDPNDRSAREYLRMIEAGFAVRKQ